MPQRKTFGEHLREWRLAVDKSMGQVARELGITVVYFSEVENGKKKPFVPGSALIKKLADAVRQPLYHVEAIAANERDTVEVHLRPGQDNSFVLAFARMQNDNTLTADQINKIRQALKLED